MVKFLSGTQYDGTLVPVCTFWRTDVTTDKDDDYAELQTDSNAGNCVANHYFSRDEISCFNEGDCNGEGKCLPCTKYKYGAGMRMGISHSPPLDFLKQFNKGLDDVDLLSPQLRAVGVPVETVAKDQLPFHIILRNIQASIAKCCRWSTGDGQPSQFTLARIIDGPDTVTVSDINGDEITLKGIRVRNAVFPDDGTETNPEGGSFFPVGVPVVAGWADQPSFYLEPKTGLVKNGEGVIFRSSEDSTAANAQARALLVRVPSLVEDSINVIGFAGNQATRLLNEEIAFFNNLDQSAAPAEDKEAAADQVTAKQEAVTAIQDAETEANDLKTSIDAHLAAIEAAEAASVFNQESTALAGDLDALAAQLDIVSANAGGQPAADAVAGQSRQLRILAQNMSFSGSGGFTKCELFFEDNNPAAQWNAPEDGSLPCNGMRSDCKFYSGPTWQFATTEKMELGQNITAEAIQEIRFYSDDWSRFNNPEEEFRNRFSTPFIWAFKDYTDVTGTPNVEDMLLYRPKVLFAREGGNPEDDNPDTLDDAFETMRVEKVSISNFTEFSVAKSASPIKPGSETLDNEQTPSYASLISPFNVPSFDRLKITHPPTDSTFVYKTWSPRFTNRISIFGTATPNRTIYIVNNTALKNRQRYHQFFETTDIFDIPTGGLPGASSGFNGIEADTLRSIFDELSKEKSANQSEAVLGFDSVSSDITGFWESRVEVDVVHNEINEIFAFILQDDGSVLHDKTIVDYRFLHSIVTQDSFSATDFTLQDAGGGEGGSVLGADTGNFSQDAQLAATSRQIVGSEPVTLDYGYYAWRVKNRNLQQGLLSVSSDLQGETQVADTDSVNIVTEADASQFISAVTYRVVQYRKENVEIPSDDWYLLHDCGIIMARVADPNAHRVLPLPDQSGEVQPLTNVLINNGATGSVIAPWALESATLEVDGEEKALIQLYRNVDGVGLPANYVILGPALGAENLFGRPDPARDTLSVTFTYLRAQTHKQKSAEEQTPPESDGIVVEENFYGDILREHDHNITFSSGGLSAGGPRPNHIARQQQDYCFVFKDLEGRPIGRKVARFMVCYYNLACVNVEIFYSWRGTCTTYGLIPDRFLRIGSGDGTVTSPPKGSTNPEDLELGFRVSSLLGNHPCGHIPNCGDHEVIRLGPTRKEFEVISNVSGGEGEDVIQKAFFPSAGQEIEGEIVSTERPGSQWQLKRGAMWYPYTDCERPRYRQNTNGPLNTDSSELINETVKNPGMASALVGANQLRAGGGEFGGLPPQYQEAYRGPDQVVARILDVHPSLRPCTSAFTYGNQVLQGGLSFSGYARRRGEVDTFWYEGLQWEFPPFGNFGRARLMIEVSEKVGDYLDGDAVGIRWMPMFPEREDLGANLEVFSEEIEPVHYRLTGSLTPLGAVNETAPDEESPRFTHNSLITNRASAGIEYPYAPYYPTFLPNALLGLEPDSQGFTQGEQTPRGTISTAWAWREQDKPVRRGQAGSKILPGFQFQLPDYFLDNRRMEVRLRPEEGLHTIRYESPVYDLDGALLSNATVRLDDGPSREVVIDFANRELTIANQPDTLYDTSKILGEDPFSCSPAFSSNRHLAERCGCEGDPAPESENLPAVFLHLDSLAPESFVGLYATSEIGPAFPTDLPRDSADDPCCMCNYFIEGIFFRLDSEFLPATLDFNPIFNGDVETFYTWSRVPHGLVGGTGRDGGFNGQENLAQNLVDKFFGNVFQNRIFGGRSTVSAYFPSPQEAQEAAAGGPGILVPGPLDGSAPKLLGGTPALGGISQGQPEPIVLDFQFSTFIKIKEMTITFLAGKDMQVPTTTLAVIPPQERTGLTLTQRAGRTLAVSAVTANGSDVPNPENFDDEDIENGTVLLEVKLTPSYGDVPFWDSFGQEFHLTFAGRDSAFSMGIHSIVIDKADGMVPGTVLTETIFLPERKYYTSTFVPNGKNPMEFLAEQDSATAYWRSTNEAPDQGANRFRAYSWGQKVTEDATSGPGGGNPTIEGAIEDLELLQADEYNAARRLMNDPYSYQFSSFFPLAEQNWLNFLGGAQPSWTTSLSVSVSDIDKISDAETGQLVYGEIPSRSPWSAPGHAWTYIFEESYIPCCDGCVDSLVINYEFAHLHDNLQIVETAAFWEELPTGFNRIFRSTMISPDVTFGQSQETGLGITGGTTNRPVLLDEGLFTDAQGNPIPVEVLENAGFAKDPDGNGFVIVGEGAPGGSV